MPWALVFAADISAGFGAANEPIKRRNMEAILGNWEGLLSRKTKKRVEAGSDEGVLILCFFC